MANEEQMQQDIADFERSRQQLMGISSQKQQMQFQSAAVAKAIEALEKTKEKKVFKALGNILIQSDVSDVSKELKEQNEIVSLRVKSLQKQEESIVQKLNKLKAKIEGKEPAGETAEAAANGQQKQNNKKKQ